MTEDLSKQERVRRYGEVFTPQWVVDRMCDKLPEDAFEPEKTFLEPTCGDGVFVCEILRRKFARCRTRKEYATALGSVYAMDIQQRNVDATVRNVTALCAEFFKVTQADAEIIRNHVILCDSLKIMRMMSDPQLWSKALRGGGEGETA